jgi:hypothetical protein
MCRLTLAACVVSLGFVAGCSGSATPSTPSPTPAPVAPRTAAQLAIEDASVNVQPLPTGSAFGYDVRFALRETSGKSGATIQNVLVGDLKGGGDNTGPGCWRDSLRVPPGGTLDVFYTDAGQRSLGYCAPWTSGDTPTPQVMVTVTFVDDDGRIGTVDTVVAGTN